MNVVHITVDNPDELLAVGAYGAGALVRLEASADGAVYVEDSTQAIVSGTTTYTFYDADGATSTWYRTRYSDAGATVFSEYSAPFQSRAAYATTATLKALIGTTDTNDDPLLAVICDRVNAYIEQVCGRIIGPVPSAVYLLDGDGTDRLWFPAGIRAVSLLEIADYSGGTYTTETATNYYLRPSAARRAPGWPATWLVLSDQSGQHRTFPKGYDTVRMTATTGWPQVPDDVIRLALTVAQRWWNARQSGYQTVDGIDEQGRPIAARFFQLPDYQTLNAYTIPIRAGV